MPWIRHIANKQEMRDSIRCYSGIEQAAGFDAEAFVELLSNFSGQDYIQIIYKPQLVYYLQKTFLFNQVNCFS